MFVIFAYDGLACHTVIGCIGPAARDRGLVGLRTRGPPGSLTVAPDDVSHDVARCRSEYLSQVLVHGLTVALRHGGPPRRGPRRRGPPYSSGRGRGGAA